MPSVPFSVFGRVVGEAPYCVAGQKGPVGHKIPLVFEGRDLGQLGAVVSFGTLREITAFGSDHILEATGISRLLEDVELVVNAPDIGDAGRSSPACAVKMVLGVGHRPCRVELVRDLAHFEVGGARTGFVAHAPDDD